MIIKLISNRCLMIGLMWSGLLQAGEVRSISREVESSFEGTTVWTVYVKCTGVSDERAIERSGDSPKWCAEELPTLCNRQKVKLADKVCGRHFERLVGTYRLNVAKEEAMASDN